MTQRHFHLPLPSWSYLELREYSTTVYLSYTSHWRRFNSRRPCEISSAKNITPTFDDHDQIKALHATRPGNVKVCVCGQFTQPGVDLYTILFGFPSQPIKGIERIDPSKHSLSFWKNGALAVSHLPGV
jgi:hypothetical protein